mmetsp:Transcript_27821/g.59479  ORF Transcript_27821/g.59479 Transcript_27821/m.59479 type:complete len:202 (-) Transcript_27821:66-671(-)
MPPPPEPVGSVGGREGRQQEDGDPVDHRVPVGELRPQDGNRLEGITHQEGLADVLPEPAVVDGTGVPEYPAAGQPEAAVESKRFVHRVVVAATRDLGHDAVGCQEREDPKDGRAHRIEGKQPIELFPGRTGRRSDKNHCLVGNGSTNDGSKQNSDGTKRANQLKAASKGDRSRSSIRSGFEQARFSEKCGLRYGGYPLPIL